ncbi:MAG: hypothetical protein V3R99_09355 [Thermoguttaceae bacterium]
MAVNFAAFWIVLAVVGLLLLGGLVAIIALLINPKTRVAGIVLLAIVVLAVVLVGGAGLYLMLDAPVPAPQAMAVGLAYPLTFHTG